MHTIKYIVQAINYQDRGGYWRDVQRGRVDWVDWEVTARKPEGVELSVVNAYQVFLRSCTDRTAWRVNCYDLRENEHDIAKLDNIEVLRIEPITKQTHKPLFAVNGGRI